MHSKKRISKTNRCCMSRMCAVAWSTLSIVLVSLMVMGYSVQEPMASIDFPKHGMGGQLLTVPYEKPAVLTVGLLDTDGSVLYSILLANGPGHALGDLTITGAVPEHTTSVEAVASPPGAIFMSQTGSSKLAAVWHIKELKADIILGPFTYRVKLNDQTAPIPASFDATVSWTTPGEGRVETTGGPTPIQPLAESGSIMIDENGTKGLAAVGDTGILVYIPAGAVSEPTTLTLARLSVDDDANFPHAEDIPEAESMSWCASVRMTADRTVKFTQPILLAVPIYQTLTPGLFVESFVGLPAGAEPILLGERPDYISLDGNHAIVSCILPEEFQRIVLAIGVDAYDKAQSTVKGNQLAFIGYYGPVIGLFRW